MSCHVLSRHVVLCMSCHVVTSRVMSCYDMTCYVMSRLDVVSCLIVSGWFVVSRPSRAVNLSPREESMSRVVYATVVDKSR